MYHVTAIAAKGPLDPHHPSIHSFIHSASTVDYAIASEDLLNTTLAFQVQSLTMYSDHCPISLKLIYSRSHTVKDNTFRQPLRKIYLLKITLDLWKTDSKTKFINALSSPSVQEQIDYFSSEHYTSVDDEVSHFNQIINTVAKSCLVPSRKSSKHK